MPTITASSIVGRATTILQDTTNVRWPQDELLKWLNDGQREIVLLKPDAYSKVETVTLVAGTKQTLPAAGVMLLDVVRNMGTDGSTPGRAIRLVDREIMDAQNATWHADSASSSVIHYIYNPNAPKTYYVYPPQPSSNFGQVEIIYSASPSDVTINQTVTIDDIYANALLDYILYRAYSKDADYAGNAQRAVVHYQAFMASLGQKAQMELLEDPNAKSNAGPFASVRKGQ